MTSNLRPWSARATPSASRGSISITSPSKRRAFSAAAAFFSRPTTVAPAITAAAPFNPIPQPTSSTVRGRPSAPIMAMLASSRTCSIFFMADGEVSPGAGDRDDLKAEKLGPDLTDRSLHRLDQFFVELIPAVLRERQVIAAGNVVLEQLSQERRRRLDHRRRA